MTGDLEQQNNKQDAIYDAHDDSLDEILRRLPRREWPAVTVRGGIALGTTKSA